MQQIGKGPRFWWRALDAPTPQPAIPSPARMAIFQHTRARMPVPAEPFTLSIPKGDRRSVRKQNASRLKTAALSVLALSAIAVVSAAAAVLAPEGVWRDIRSELRVFADDALIAVGFGIEQVSLNGQRYALDSDVFDALDLGNVRTFAALDTEAALHRIARIPWVDSAQITRVFPGRLNITIKERAPSALWTRGNTTYLIDATGRTLGPLPPKSGWILPRVAGEGANVDIPLLLTALERHDGIKSQFNYAERVAERRWRVVLSNGSRIELAPDREFEGLALVAANRTLSRAISGAPVIVDVRTAGRASLRPLAASASFAGSRSHTTPAVTP